MHYTQSLYGTEFGSFSACDMRICTSNAKICTKSGVEVGSIVSYGAFLSVLRIVGNRSWMSEVGLREGGSLQKKLFGRDSSAACGNQLMKHNAKG